MKLTENWYNDKIDGLKNADAKTERLFKRSACICEKGEGFINTDSFEFCKVCWGVITFKEGCNEF